VALLMLSLYLIFLVVACLSAHDGTEPPPPTYPTTTVPGPPPRT
jgi:hypothetical protein